MTQGANAEVFTTALLVLPEGSASLTDKDEAQTCAPLSKLQFHWP